MSKFDAYPDDGPVDYEEEHLRDATVPTDQPHNDAALQLRMGVYRHYKGPLYQVLALAHDANWPHDIRVVYFPLQLDGAHEGPRLAVRHLEDFTSWVCVNRDCMHFGSRHWELCAYCRRNVEPFRPVHTRCIREHTGPRFKYLGPEFRTEMLVVQ